ncbi:MAG: hypothetical protein KDD44_12065, partial [Bdellovibrionales bacterium]|nr:hypothetical protein [Bdellovibrionales bacterium]
ILNENYEELSRIFAITPTRKVVLRFLTPEEFHAQTGAPTWTSAMFFQGEITVPLRSHGRVNSTQLRRALRHEYVHAVVAELSNNRAPAWLDEGIAQLIEGQPNPLLGPALRKWISHDSPLPLNWLENGFTTLDEKLVPTAYAQSLFATRTLVNSHGFPAVTAYLKRLGDGTESDVAFEEVFGKPLNDFERQLAPLVERWAQSRNPHP